MTNRSSDRPDTGSHNVRMVTPGDNNDQQSVPITAPTAPSADQPPVTPPTRRRPTTRVIALVAAAAAVVLTGGIATAVNLASSSTPTTRPTSPQRIFSDCPFAAGGCPGAHTTAPTTEPASVAAVVVPSISLPPPSP